MSTIIVGSILAGMVILALRSIVKTRQSGGCGCGCEGCGLSCPSEKEK